MIEAKAYRVLHPDAVECIVQDELWEFDAFRIGVEILDPPGSDRCKTVPGWEDDADIEIAIPRDEITLGKGMTARVRAVAVIDGHRVYADRLILECEIGGIAE